MKRVAFLLFLSFSFLSTSYLASAECSTEPVFFALMQNVTSAIRQAQARYDSGNVTGAAELARKILAKYPDNADAKAILVKCIATEKEDYENAVESMSVSRLLDFQKKYPNSDFSTDVEKRINDLPLWLNAKNKNTVASYKQYLSESTHQLYKREAVDSIDELTVKQAYDAAVATNTIKAFEQFRNAYPGSRYDKQASNKIARLMADKFNSRSTYDDKYKALTYATNEMTRDYVKNKYNKAMENKNSATSTYSSNSGSSYSGSYSSNNYSNRSYESGYRSYKSDYNSDPAIMFGIDLSGEWMMDLSMYGIGPILRFGRMGSPIFGTVAFKYSYARIHSTYSTYDYYYGRNNVTINASNEYLTIPMIVNWDIFGSLGLETLGFYIGLGYVYNSSLKIEDGLFSSDASSWTVQMGFCLRHYDLKFGCNYYSSTVTQNDNIYDRATYYLGFSYYF